MTDTVLTPHHLSAVLSHWELAIFASDLHLFDVDSKEESSAFVTLLNSGVDAQQAWLQVTGTSMLPSVASHLAVRQRLRSDLGSKKALSRVLGRWVKNCRVLSEKPYTMLQRLCERVQGFALMVPPEEVGSLTLGATTWDTLPSVLNMVQRDWALAASLTVLLHVVVALRGTTQVSFVGAITSVPTTWNALPQLAHVSTDLALPRSDGGDQYYVLVKTGAGSHVVLQVSAHIGQVAEKPVPPFPVDDAPWWVAHTSAPQSTIIVGGSHHIVNLHTDRGVQPLSAGPRRGTLTKGDNMVIWSDKRDLCSLDLVALQAAPDHARVQQTVLRRAQTAACACVQRNVVFQGGAPLFALPEGHSIAAVASSGREYVDVFTTVGDWWRVHSKTLSAVVVGLDLLQGARVVDVCLLETDMN